jgi:hypothetical protein
MSDALSRLQKFSGTCTPAAFGAEPPSWEHPHAATKTTAIATHNSKQRLTGLSERDTALGIARSLQHPGTEHPRDKRRAGFDQRDSGPIVRLVGSKSQLARSICLLMVIKHDTGSFDRATRNYSENLVGTAYAV